MGNDGKRKEILFTGRKMKEVFCTYLILVLSLMASIQTKAQFDSIFKYSDVVVKGVVIQGTSAGSMSSMVRCRFEVEIVYNYSKKVTSVQLIQVDFQLVIKLFFEILNDGFFQ